MFFFTLWDCGSAKHETIRVITIRVSKSHLGKKGKETKYMFDEEKSENNIEGVMQSTGTNDTVSTSQEQNINTNSAASASQQQYGYNQGNYNQAYNNYNNYQSEQYYNNTTSQQGQQYQSGQQYQTAKPKVKKEKKSGGAGRFFKKAAALVLSGIIFGCTAGGVMYGVYYFGMKDSLEKEVNIPSVSDTINSVSNVVSQGNGGASSSMDVSSVASAAMPAMVALQGTTTVSSGSYFGYGQAYEAATSGTGIIVGKNDKELLILTNAHVVEDVNDLQCVFIDKTVVKATLKGSVSDKDIAVVAVALNDLQDETLSNIAVAELASSEDVVIGQEVVAIGNALGEGQSVTNGIISAIDREITVNNITFSGLFMTNAAINSGNSGGALLNADGKVIGINFAKTSEDGVEGMAYSIPVSNVRNLIDSLMNRETRTKVTGAEASQLGIQGVDITSSISEASGYPKGVQIRSVLTGSAAEKAGLEKYDIIVSFDGQTVSSMSGLKSIMQYYRAGETVSIGYYHIEGNEYVKKTTDVTLDSVSGIK